MPQVVNTNIGSINAQRNLNATQNAMQVSLQRLSSGLRINSAKDDAAGLAVSQKMLGQIKSINQAVRNANDGISMIQTAEGGMQEAQTMLQRMRELSVQAASDTISDTERGYINTEMQQLLTEVNAIADRTKFNGQSLLTGSLKTTLGGAEATDLVVGSALSTTQVAVVTAIDVSGAQSGKTYTFSSAAAGTLTLTRSGDNVAQTVSVGAIAANASATYDFGTLGIKVTVQNTGAAAKAAADIITDITAAANDTVVTAAGSGSATFQIGADAGAGNSTTMSFSNMKIDTLANGAAAAMDTLNTALSDFNTGTATRAEAETVLSSVEGALDYISSQRATLGAVMNRLGNTISSLQATSENLSAARSRIVDADFAAETAELTRSQILQQAGVAMLAQANALPNNVLALLKG